MIRLVVVAPTVAMRAGLRAMLSAASFPATSRLEVIDEAASLSDLGSIPPQTDVLIMVETAAETELRRVLLPLQGQLALLLLTDDPQAAQHFKELPLRAWGILAFDTSAEELAAAVYALNEGLLVGAPALLQPLLPRYLSGEITEADPLTDPLTERESEVLQLLAHGLANKQIAAALSISEHTVKFHVSSIYAKLGATNRTEAVRTGVKQGLVLL